MIESTQLASYIRNYELDFLNNSLVAEPLNDMDEDLPAHRVRGTPGVSQSQPGKGWHRGKAGERWRAGCARVGNSPNQRVELT